MLINKTLDNNDQNREREIKRNYNEFRYGAEEIKLGKKKH